MRSAIMRPVYLGVRLTADERAQLERLAQREERTASDLVRRLIRQAAQTTERAPKDGGAFAVSRGS